MPTAGSGEAGIAVQSDSIIAIESAIITIIRELSLPATHEAFIRQSGVSVERAGAGVLRMLADSGALRVSELAQRLGVDTSTMSRHVKGLAIDGYVERAGDPSDGRAAQVALTEKGLRAMESLIGARHQFFTEMLAGWSEHDRSTLAPLLSRLAARALEISGRS